MLVLQVISLNKLSKCKESIKDISIKELLLYNSFFKKILIGFIQSECVIIILWLYLNLSENNILICMFSKTINNCAWFIYLLDILLIREFIKNKIIFNNFIFNN